VLRRSLKIAPDRGGAGVEDAASVVRLESAPKDFEAASVVNSRAESAGQVGFEGRITDADRQGCIVIDRPTL